jgi:hypothetical protein
MHLCTAPCFPPCAHEVTQNLLNAKSRSILGQNCKEHIASLLDLRDKDGKLTNDYSASPLELA